MSDDRNNIDNEINFKVKKYFNRNQKLTTIDWLEDISEESGIVEIAFKNTRKGFFSNELKLPLQKGDIVAVEADSGHDVGVVSLKGTLAEKQFNRKIRKKQRYRFMKIWRKATHADLEKFLKAKEKEIPIRNRAREIAKSMNFDMKISDVEIQGDNTKAIFYFLADGRIDFRDLIKLYAREFQLKIEMKQIGARQEAAMIGGIDLSGREFCGSTWKTELESVKSATAKIQQLNLNDPKLLDHSGNLKSCLMYELDTYIEAWEKFPKNIPPLDTASGTYYPHKIDVLKGQVWFSVSKETMINSLALPVDQIKEIISKNQEGKKPPLPGNDMIDFTEHDFTSGSADFSKDKPLKRKKSGKGKRRKSRKTRKQRN